MAEAGTAPTARPLAFWDIESLANIFMFAVYSPDCSLFMNPPETHRDELVYYYLFDGMELTDALKDRILKRIFEKNTRLDPTTSHIRFENLKAEATNKFLVKLFCVDNKQAFAKSARENDFYPLNPKPHTDLDGDTRFPYMLGFNTANYDCVMMAHYFNETWGIARPGAVPVFTPVTAASMRRFNDRLFGAYRDNMRQALQGKEKNIYENMLRSGLYIDAAKVNDKVYMIPLKRIMGMLGMDIFEDGAVASDKPVTDPDEIATLFAYNASDDIKLCRMFNYPAFKAQFQLKKGLLDAYPDIIYKDENGRKTVRVNRMKADDTAARFAQRVLCPDGRLPDIRAVSFEYPKGSGRNILQETREWAAGKFKDNPKVIRDHLDPIFNWYGAIEGNNFNVSAHYKQTYREESLKPIRIEDIPQPRTAVPYFNADGTPSRTYVNFGIGGIHGAEYDKDKYESDVREYLENCRRIMSFLKAMHPSLPSPAEGSREEAEFYSDTAAVTESLPDSLIAKLKAMPRMTLLDGVKYKLSDYATIRKDGTVTLKWPRAVSLFTQDKKSGKWNLNKKYSYTSDDEVDHQDFTSYYPCLLMNLKAYDNTALGEDRYAQQFEKKGVYGMYMKDKSRPESERGFYATLREGTKLILNAASGASDTVYDNPIRMNNVILSMRLIGQLFTWRIGQAETLEGYKVTSTNTDGLYAACTEETRPRLREILAAESASINVDIEPEAMRLVSKDANNRIEVSLDGKILGASGSDVARHMGPMPHLGLPHPALIDRMMADYLVKHGVNESFDPDRAAAILQNIKNELTPFDLLMLYQQIFNSSEKSVRYIYGEMGGEIRTFQHNNRAFAIKSEGVHLHIANGQNIGAGHDATADKVLRAYGIDPSRFANTRIVKISGHNPEQNMFIYNQGLDELPDAMAHRLLDDLDDSYYVGLFRATYNNWCNVTDSGDGNGTGEDAV